MNKIVKVAVVLASVGLISSAYADNSTMPNSKDTSTKTSSSSSLGSSTPSGAKATDDQVLVGGSSGTSAAPQSTSNQGSIKQEHSSDEDLD